MESNYTKSNQIFYFIVFQSLLLNLSKLLHELHINLVCNQNYLHAITITQCIYSAVIQVTCR